MAFGQMPAPSSIPSASTTTSQRTLGFSSLGSTDSRGSTQSAVTAELIVEPRRRAGSKTPAIVTRRACLGLAWSSCSRCERAHSRLRRLRSASRLRRRRNVRCSHAVGRFRHLIVYMTLVDAVHVLAFTHPRRCPSYWAIYFCAYAQRMRRLTPVHSALRAVVN